MSEDRKRKLLEEWSCPVCLDTVGEQCIPAVMNGCVPFAHVACLSCLNELLAQKNALCPECRVPFASVRPLAAFVDKDDPVIADALAKKARVVTLGDRLAALEIEDERTKKRVAFVARRTEKSLTSDYYRVGGSVIAWSTKVPLFDKDRVCLLASHTQRVMKRRMSLAQLGERLDWITNSIIPYLCTLFPDCTFLAHRRRRDRHSYMCLNIRKK